MTDAPAEDVTGRHRRVLDAVFRHPVPHNLEWRQVVGLVANIGNAHEKPNGEYVFEAGGESLTMRRPHNKDATTQEVAEIRKFLSQAGFSPVHPSQAATPPDREAPDLLIVADHHGTKIFRLDVSSDTPLEHEIRPDDPHHFLHHLMHKDQEQRASEEPAYYEAIAEAAARGGRIVVVGHGAGNSNAAHHLVEYLLAHHPETHRRIVREVLADLSSITTPQLLDLARTALRT